MVIDQDGEPADFGLVAPISLPSDGKVPDPQTGASTAEEYDRYFRILRDEKGLVGWSRSCLQLTETVLRDLADGDLADREQRDILRGFVLVLQTTLHRWVSAMEDGTAAEEGAR